MLAQRRRLGVSCTRHALRGDLYRRGRQAPARGDACAGSRTRRRRLHESGDRRRDRKRRVSRAPMTDSRPAAYSQEAKADISSPAETSAEIEFETIVRESYWAEFARVPLYETYGTRI